jgi:putative CocE/NonD family hydrolase
MVHASIRGTGCSGGRFDLFDRRSAEDGFEIIENWIVRQRWSNERVGIIGHSYPGLTGFLVAETDPPHLKAIAVSGLIDDFYRGVTYIGGVPDPGFPLLWSALLRPGSEYSGNLPRYAQRDPVCAENIATREPPNAVDDPIVNGTADREDGPWWAAHSLITNIRGITKPIWIAQQYQDEQTGPRGGVVLWQSIPKGIPKRLVLTNGVHATNDIAQADRVAWLDCWVTHDGHGCPGGVADPSKRVQIHFETTGPGNDPQFDSVNPAYVSSDYPLPETMWRRCYLRGNGRLSTQRPQHADAGRSYLDALLGRESYLSGPGVADSLGTQTGNAVDRAYAEGYGPVSSSSGPDELTYTLPFARETAIAGPVEVTLWASMTAPDADFFVQLVDRDPQGNLSYLQRGLLRASFRALDQLRSDRIARGPLAGAIYRSYHPFTNPQNVIPGQVNRYEIEVFPIGYVFRPGHQLLVQIYAPPAMDEFYVYGSGQPPSINTIVSDRDHPSSILLPFMPVMPPVRAQSPRCGTQTGVRCVRPLA